MRHLPSSGSKKARASKLPVAVGESLLGRARVKACAILEARPDIAEFRGEAMDLTRRGDQRQPGLFDRGLGCPRWRVGPGIEGAVDFGIRQADTRQAVCGHSETSQPCCTLFLTCPTPDRSQLPYATVLTRTRNFPTAYNRPS